MPLGVSACEPCWCTLEDASQNDSSKAQDLLCPEISPHNLEVLQTTYVSVFQTNQDETEYVMPFALCGTPLAKITEDSDYWNPTWCSLDDFLATDVNEEALKQESIALRQIETDNKSLQKRAIMHGNNITKYHKIREIFWPDSSYHPNQVVSKYHLQPGGLCQREIMYRLACKVSDLQELQSKGLLSMDPWDFIRWRYSLKIQERVTLLDLCSGKFLRSLVRRLGESPGPANSFRDTVMREAALVAAKYRNRLGNYHSERKKSSGSEITVASKQSGSETTAPAKRSGSGTKLSSKRKITGTTVISKRPRSISWLSILHPRSRAQLSADAAKARQPDRKDAPGLPSSQAQIKDLTHSQCKCGLWTGQMTTVTRIRERVLMYT